MSDQQILNTPDGELSLDRFVGREEFLIVIDEAIADAPQCHLISFLGVGGVGKTALLRKVSRKYSQDNDVIVIQLDYGQASFQSLPALTRSFVAQLLGRGIVTLDDMQPYQEKLDKAEKAFKEGEGDKIVRQLEVEANLLLVTTISQKLSELNKRMLILSDTVEATEDVEQGRRSNMLASKFSNTVLVLAARPTPIVLQRFEEEMPNIYGVAGWRIHPVRTIEAFTNEEVFRYFSKSLPTPLKPELLETIALLTERRPVLLALVVEWFKHSIQLPEEVNKSKEELESLDPLDLQHLRKYFERALVERVRAIRGPLDRAILYMSFLDRRYDRRILQLVLDPLSSEEVAALESELQKMAFIRSFLDESSGLLHDEAKRLINQHAWPAHDPRGEERCALARKVIDGFYLPEIVKLRLNIAKSITIASAAQLPAYHPDEVYVHALEMECLGYHYKISFDDGRRYVTRLIQEGVSLVRREGVSHEVSYIDACEATITMARMDVARGQFEGNREILEQALEREGLSSWYRIALLSELSDIPTNPEGKATYLRQALEIAERTQDQREVAKVYNHLGLMYRRQGLWAQAEESYQRTLDILRVIDDPAQKAGTLNNLAYVKMLRGELDLAESLAGIALKIRESTGNQVGLAFSYLTLGDVADAKGSRDQAMQAYRAAANLFSRLGLDQNHAQALIRLAEDKRRDRNFEAAEKLLQIGLDQPPAIRAWAERELGVLYRTQGMQSEDLQERAEKCKTAIAVFQQSLETCKQKQDWYGRAQALYDLIFTSYVMNRCIDEDYAAQLKAVLAAHDYPIFRAQLDEIYADITYDSNEVIPSFRQYIEVARALSIYHIRKYEAMFNRLKRKFLAQPEGVQQELCNYFDQVVAELPQGSRLRSSLDNLSQAIKIAY